MTQMQRYRKQHFWNSHCFLATIVNTEDEVYLLSEEEQLPCSMSAPSQNEKRQQFYYFWSSSFSVSGAVKCLTFPVKGTKPLPTLFPLFMGKKECSSLNKLCIQLCHLITGLKYSLTLKLINELSPPLSIVDLWDIPTLLNVWKSTSYNTENMSLTCL